MKTLYTFNNRCKVFALAILSFLLLLTGTQYANAQATKTFTIPDKNILVSYNELPAGQAGTITFTLTNKSGSAMTTGTAFNIALPAQQGFNYVSAIKFGTGLSISQAPPMIMIDKDFSSDSTLTFSFPMLISNSEQRKIVLRFVKQ